MGAILFVNLVSPALDISIIFGLTSVDQSINLPISHHDQDGNYRPVSEI